MNDPIRIYRRRTRASWTLGIVAVLLCAWFAVVSRPESTRTVVELDTLHSSADEPASPETINLSAYEQARIWVEPAPVAVAEPEQRAPDPVLPEAKLELLAVVINAHEQSNEPVRLAAIYDPAQDRLFIVGSGESVGPHEIAEVDEESVVVMTGSRMTTLRLRRLGLAGKGGRS